MAFNLHFLLHLGAGWLAMRALSRSSFGAWMYLLSGLAVSLTAFYSLVTAFALVPLALWGARRNSVLVTGGAFGLLALAGEPVTILSAALAVAVAGRMPVLRLIAAVGMSLAVASPQILSWLEIAGEVERARRYSAATALAASLEPWRILEFAFVPLRSLGSGQDLFLSLFLGVIVVPALWSRSRWTLLAAMALFFALGRFNPLVRWAVETFDGLRLARYPEKFAIVLTVALVVLAADYYARSGRRRFWRWVTFVPLGISAAFVLPVDRFAFYDPPPASAARICARAESGGQEPSRAEYRQRARRLEPLFGAVAGLRYAVNRSGDGMHSLLSRIAAERAVMAPPEVAVRYPRLAGCMNVPGALPPAMFAPSVAVAPTVTDAVRAIERPGFDPWHTVIAPRDVNPGLARRDAVKAVPTLSYRQEGQTIRIVAAPEETSLLMVNQSYFHAWQARSGARELETLPVNLDRLGIVVPPGHHEIVLRFGRQRLLVAGAWLLSLALLTLFAVALRVEHLDGRAGQVERAGGHDAAVL